MSSKLDLSGLAQFGDMLKNPAATAPAGKPLELDVSLIDEDPNQPRKEFDEEALQELANNIAERGVKSPISVHPHPTEPGRYIVNHGARRLRASKLAGKTTIKAFVDEDHGDFDQVAENIQRENFTPRELADFIARKRAEGMKDGAIAKGIGKSPTWLSRYAALLDLPEPIQAVFDAGQSRDVSTIYELLLCWKKDQAKTADFLMRKSGAPISREDVESLRVLVNRKEPAPTAAAVPVGEGGTTMPEAGQGGETSSPQVSAGPQERDDGGDNDRQQNVRLGSNAEPKAEKVKKPLVQVKVGRREAVLNLSKPAEYGLVWVSYEDATEEQLDVAKVKLVAVTDGKP